MSWDAIGAIGEIIGAVAVVVSLIYLAMQIRIQNAESRAMAVHQILEGYRLGVASFSEKDIAEIFLRANKNVSELTEVERFRLVTSSQGILRLWEEAFHNVQEKSAGC